jgi:hypothetical protein
MCWGTFLSYVLSRNLWFNLVHSQQRQPVPERRKSIFELIINPGVAGDLPLLSLSCLSRAQCNLVAIIIRSSCDTAKTGNKICNVSGTFAWTFNKRLAISFVGIDWRQEANLKRISHDSYSFRENHKFVQVHCQI